MEALQRLHNRGSISTGYDIDNSLKFESDNSERISFTPSSAVASERRKHTISFWIKRTELGSTQYIYEWGGSEGDYLRNLVRFQSDDTLRFATSYNVIINTTRVFRDTSAWYHIVIQTDTVQSSNSDTKFWIYVNGELEASSTAFNASDTMAFANNSQHDIGFTSVDNAAYGNYYLAEFHAVGGLKLAPTEFGEYDEDSGIWKPKAYAGSYGTNGFYLDFSDAANLGDDASGNGNNFTETNITSADQATDTPTNNFCTINTIEYTGGYNITNGGTQAERNGNTAWYSTTSSMGVSKGKWYWEAQFASGATSFMAGVSIDSYISTQANPFDGQYLGSGSGDGGFGYNNAGNVYYNNTVTSGYGSAPSTNIIGLAIDMDNEKAYVSINGTWQNSGDPTSGATGTGAIDLFLDSNGDTAFFSLCAYNPNYTHKINFGGYTTMSISSAASDDNGYGNFEYAPPSGYYALCTKNLEEFG
jgi:hypothetical protein